MGVRHLIAGTVAVAALAACDTGARKDLPDENQKLDHSEAEIQLFPDKFPNTAHKCVGDVGTWTTTDRGVWIVYGDPKCGGSGPTLILTNVPGRTGVNDTEAGDA